MVNAVTFHPGAHCSSHGERLNSFRSLHRDELDVDGMMLMVFLHRRKTVQPEMKMVTAAEIMKIVTSLPAKHCSLDPAPTWLVKRALPLLADTIALMCSASMTEGVFPDVLKHAIVLPRLRKPTLDPAELSSYRLKSNLSFISKTVELVVAARHVSPNMSRPSVCCRLISRPIGPTTRPRPQSQPSMTS